MTWTFSTKLNQILWKFVNLVIFIKLQHLQDSFLIKYELGFFNSALKLKFKKEKQNISSSLVREYLKGISRAVIYY